MASSISPSETRLPRRALLLLAFAAAAWGLAALYSLRWNPEVAFFKHGAAVKRDYEHRLRERHTNITIIFGGSSCATAIDGQRLLERHGLPVLNLGLGAGMGARVLTRQALESVRPGDTLLVALEPDLLGGRVELEPLGVQFAFASGRRPLLREGQFLHWPAVLLDLRPGGGHVTAMLGKLVGRQPLFRYPLAEWQPDGRHQIAARRPIADPKLDPFHLSADGRAALVALRDTCARRGVRTAYVLPWQYCPPALRAARDRQQLAYLLEVSEFIPVLREPRLGSHAIKEHFADTSVHPVAEAAALRSDELAASLSAWRLWTRPELLAEVAAASKQVGYR